MKRIITGHENALPITDYGSSFHLIRLLRSETKETRVGIAYLAPGDQIARHRAGFPQLFCVLEGSGWVSGDDEIEHPITTGEAAFWSHGELHATRTDTGLSALMVESEELEPEAILIEA
jgi:quercetin dioxygenase-like cupin family protein